MKKVLILFIVLGVMQSYQAHACSCIMDFSPEQALQRAQAVFSGKVTDIQKPFILSSSMEPMMVTMEVFRFWKGVSQNQLSLYTASGGEASCGFDFKDGEEYLVYANDSDGDLYVSLCSRTASLALAQEDLNVLGAGTQIADAPGEQPLPPSSRTLEILAGILALVIAGVVYRVIPNLETD